MRKNIVIVLLLLLVAVSGIANNKLQEYGQLQVKGIQLCGSDGQPVQLKGMNMFGIMHFPECITYESFKTLATDWGCSAIRLPVYVQDKSNDRNFNDSPEFNYSYIDSCAQWSEQLGMYLIIDWHVLINGDPNDYVYRKSSEFWNTISQKYKDKHHIIYEICNEPSGEHVTWPVIANYANKMIRIIRNNDKHGIIIVGTPQWSQDLNKVNPRAIHNKHNVMYAFHFYAAKHADLMDIFLNNIHRIPVFVSEWGTGDAIGRPLIDFETSDRYLQIMDSHILNNDTVIISWSNFNYSDKNERNSALLPESCKEGLWNNVSESGEYIKNKIKNN